LKTTILGSKNLLVLRVSKTKNVFPCETQTTLLKSATRKKYSFTVNLASLVTEKNTQKQQMPKLTNKKETTPPTNTKKNFEIKNKMLKNKDIRKSV